MLEFFKINMDVHDNIHTIDTPIKFLESTQLLDVHILNDISNRNIASSIHK